MEQSLINKDLEKLKHDLRLKESLMRLLKNPDFNLLIMEGYLKNQVIDLVHNKINDITMRDNDGKIDAVCYLNEYFDQVKYNGDYAEANINQYEVLEDEQ